MIRFENLEKEFPEGKIRLIDGRLIECYPLALSEENDFVDDTLSLDSSGTFLSMKKKKKPLSPSPIVNNEEQELFLENAFFFLANKERILTNSRMFLCPVPIQSGLAYTGTSGFRNPTLGIYLQWWEVCHTALRTDEKGRRSLVFYLAGSPLSGMNRCSEVFEDGTTATVQLDSFSSYWRKFIGINTPYTKAKQKYQAYTLQQVLDILNCEADNKDFECAIREMVQASEIKKQNERIERLNAENKALAQRYRNAMCRWKEGEIVKFYHDYTMKEILTTAEVETLSEQKRDLKAALRRGEYTLKEYQPMVSAIKRSIRKANFDLSEFQREELNKIFPNDPISFYTIEEYVKGLEKEDKI